MLKRVGAAAGQAYGEEGERAWRQLRQRARDSATVQEREEQERMMGHQRMWKQRAWREQAKTGSTWALAHCHHPALAPP